jgi:hypothetical protein
MVHVRLAAHKDRAINADDVCVQRSLMGMLDVVHAWKSVLVLVWVCAHLFFAKPITAPA